MRKLKLQFQISLDGFIAGPNREMDWLTMNWSEDIMNAVASITEPIDTILLGRKLAEGFIPAWKSRAENPETAPGSEKINSTPKIVFSKSIQSVDDPHATVNNGDLAEEVKALKSQDGGDIIAYGGAEFASALIQNNLIDEYYLFVNPVALGKGLSIFGSLDSKLKLKLVEAKPFDCGIALMHYQPA